jgi:hypothetical protein
MYQLLLIGSLVGNLLTILVVRQRRASKRPERWMPDIRRVCADSRFAALKRRVSPGGGAQTR